MPNFSHNFASPALKPARFDVHLNLAAASFTAIHAAVAGTAANAYPGPITNPAVPRNVISLFGAGWDGGDIVVVGTNQFDEAITETLLANPGGNRAGVKIFKTITSISKTLVGVNAATAGLGPGNTIGFRHRLDLASAAPRLVLQFIDGVIENLGSIDVTNHAWTPGASAPDGAREYALLYPGRALE